MQVSSSIFDKNGVFLSNILDKMKKTHKKTTSLLHRHLQRPFIDWLDFYLHPFLFLYTIFMVGEEQKMLAMGDTMSLLRNSQPALAKKLQNAHQQISLLHIADVVLDGIALFCKFLTQ